MSNIFKIISQNRDIKNTIIAQAHGTSSERLAKQTVKQDYSA